MSEPKPGVRTSELWTTLATMAATMLVLLVSPETLEKIDQGSAWAGLIGLHVSNAAYALSRGLAKRRRD